MAAIAEREFGNGGIPENSADANRLLVLIDDYQTVLTALREGRDEIGTQLRGSTIGHRVASAYQVSAGLGRRQK
ncbi:MAG: hypothetical protein EOP20_01410 [Hyphomicrobiales bacterium]|nr:MAG: hypothetical protein EOP20_01410 [Hyphomicrobiales bacterium]